MIASMGSGFAAPLDGGGETGALMRTVDWASTPIGAPEAWPQSLKTTLNVLFTSRFPMFLWWGAELVQFYNDAYRPSLGANKHPRAMGQGGKQCWPEIWPVIGPLIEGVMSGGESVWFEDQLIPIDRNGYMEEVFWTFSYSPVYAEDGSVGGTLVVCSETTERVRSERRINTLRNIASSVAQATSATQACVIACDSIAMDAADVTFSLVYLLEGENHAQLAGGSGLDKHAPAAPGSLDLTAEKLIWPVGAALRTGEIQYVDVLDEAMGPFPGGPWPESTTAAVVLPLLQGGQMAALGAVVLGLSPRCPRNQGYVDFLQLLARQISAAAAQARMVEDEHARAESLAELDGAKTTFFSNISHEFRTPLTLLLGPIEAVLRDDTLAPEVLEDLRMAHRNGLRLLRLVNTLLQFSRIEAARQSASYEAADLATTTTELASAFRSAMDRAGLQFLVDCPPSLEPMYVDRDMWETIVLNLISNAFKFTFDGAVTVSLRAVEGGACLSVHDTGIGIAPDQLPLVFERFHRVEGAAGRTYEGSGIGLSLVQDLVRLHGGVITVDSALGQGSTFAVTLPCGSGHLPTAQLRAPRSPILTSVGAAPYVQEALRWLAPADGLGPIEPDGGGVKPQTGTTPPADIGHVLVVDDNADMREYVARLLAPYCTVAAVSDGEQALAAIRKQAPDLVLADVMMPKLDGFALLNAIRGNPETEDLPVILLSARAGEEATVEGLKRGADDYLAKPFTARELIARIQSHLALADLRRRAASEVRDALRLRNEIMGTVAHDLNTPLTSLQGLATLLLRQISNPRMDAVLAEKLAKGMDRSTRRMTSLVRMLGDASLLQAGQSLQLDRKPADLVTLIREEVADFCEATPDCQIAVACSVQQVVGDWDAARLCQVIENLLANAVKYSATGSPIEVAIGGAGGEAWFSVCDHGVGIDKEELPRIFEPFWRSRATAGMAHGTGLGLTGVHHIVQQHGGRIDVASEQGAGATFTVRLPVSGQTDSPRRIRRPVANAATDSKLVRP